MQRQYGNGWLSQSCEKRDEAGDEPAPKLGTESNGTMCGWLTPQFNCKGFYKSARVARTINSSFVSCNARYVAGRDDGVTAAESNANAAAGT